MVGAAPKSKRAVRPQASGLWPDRLHPGSGSLAGASGSLYAEAERPSDDLDLFAEDNEGEFEPPEGHEGNTARAVFYFYTMYPQVATPIAHIAADGLEQLYRWHLQDPPDAAEIARNARITTSQGNRNPYVDHPGLLCRAWGFECN